MKELTIEQKAKLYDKALKVLHKYDGANIMFSQSLKEEMFPELKESKDEKIRKAIIEFFESEDDNTTYSLVPKKDIITWLEKQGDKAESKFKVGDWVILDSRPVLITKVEDMPYNTHQYWTSDGTWFGDATKAKLWTIQDAKYGDVLAYNDGSLTIFSYRLSGLDAGLYMAHVLLTDKIEFKQTCAIADVHPATKEQRDTLIKAMTDAGYTFDFEKKELKKIEQKSTITPKFKVGDIIRHKELGFTCKIIAIDTATAQYEVSECNGTHLPFDFQDAWELVEQKSTWSEEDKKRVDQICEDLRCGMINFNAGKTVKGIHFEEIIESNIAWLKELEERIALQPKQEWSEEDEEEFNYIVDFIENLIKKENLVSKKTMTMEEMVTWLKSLKERYAWKPSKEQLKSLQEVINEGHFTSYPLALETLYEQLKQL